MTRRQLIDAIRAWWRQIHPPSTLQINAAALASDLNHGAVDAACAEWADERVQRVPVYCVGE